MTLYLSEAIVPDDHALWSGFRDHPPSGFSPLAVHLPRGSLPVLMNQGSRVRVACQRDGTTVLPRVWDHLEVSVSMVGLPVGVN